MKFKDYYKIMGVSETADDAQIKQSYRKLARQYHPDRNKEPGAEEKFKEIGEAYEVLKDKDKRANYDNMRQGGYHHGDDFTPPPGWQGQSGGPQMDFGDLFSNLFGGGGAQGFGGFGQQGQQQRAGNPFQQQANLKGDNVELSVSIDLDDAFNGAKRTIRVPHQGSTKTIKITIPKGTTTGKKIRLKGYGEPGHQAPGDLIITLNIKPHYLYRVEDKNLHMTLPITPWEAGLGCKLAVPTLAGKIMLTVPKNSQSGDKLRLAKRGLPSTPPGNQYVELQIVNPKVETQEQQLAYQQLAEQFDFDPRAHLPDH